jgi:ferredoxin
MKVMIDTNLCHGNIVCVEVAPEIFKINREGFGEVYTDEIPADLVDKVNEAIEKCPRQAIKIVE